ncbi:MAG TPA: ArsA-related P-loop ATPase [bacterium]|nr:ArsA-related P-loop ATPase [bacterium]
MEVFFVCGKGGVGRTAVTAGIALLCSRRGGALAVTLNDPESLAEHLGIDEITGELKSASDGIHTVCLEKQQILDDYITRQFKIGFVRQWILDHPLYPHLSAVTPGLREVLLLDRVFHYASLEYINRWNTVIVDMPATGHGTSLLNVTAVAAAAVKYGPLRRRLQQVRDKLQDPMFSRAVVVTLAEDTPVRESRELILKLQNQASVAIDSLVVNRIDLQPMSNEAIECMNHLTDPQLSAALNQNKTGEVSFTPDSVRSAVQLQHTRARLAAGIIRDLSLWWQEPIIHVRHFCEDTPVVIARAIRDSLEAGGFYG